MSLKEQIPETYAGLLAGPVAVFGVGASGRAVRELLAKLDVNPVLYDEQAGEDNVERNFTPVEAARFGLVIHSPAFRQDHPWLETARIAGCRVVSEIDFAQQFRRGPTLVVTGTNGKTTLQEFITFALKRTGISAMATGQNQYPLSRLAVHPELDGVTAVCEMGAAFALPLQEFRFEVLFWTNFHEDHLEDPKERRATFQGILRLCDLSPESSLYFGEPVFAAARELGVPLPERARGVRPEDEPGWDLPKSSAFATRIHRPALALFRRYWLESGYSDSLLKGAAEHFEVRAHRLHVTTVIGKTVYWNDSNAGNFAATEAALNNFDVPVIWIGGGLYRGGDLAAFVAKVAPRLKGAIVTGEAGSLLAPLIAERKIPVAHADDLRTAVESAHDMAAREHPVVFSPGFVAGQQYSDFIERGNCFENAVLGLKHQKGSV